MIRSYIVTYICNMAVANQVFSWFLILWVIYYGSTFLKLFKKGHKI